MEYDIRQQIAKGLQSPNMVIQHIRQNMKRSIITDINFGKSRLDVDVRYPSYGLIVEDVSEVIPIRYEQMAPDVAVDKACCSNQDADLQQNTV